MPTLYYKFRGVAEDPGEKGFPPTSKTEHSIDLISSTTAPYMPIYLLSGKELEVLHVYIDKALEKKWIRRSESSARAPILFILKKDSSLRLCVDYRGLNKVTIKNRYPLPLILEILNRLCGAKFFTKLDLHNAYHHLDIREQDRYKMTFQSRYK